MGHEEVTISYIDTNARCRAACNQWLRPDSAARGLRIRLVANAAMTIATRRCCRIGFDKTGETRYRGTLFEPEQTFGVGVGDLLFVGRRDRHLLQEFPA